MTRNRPSDLTEATRNSFGLKYPNNSVILGTKGDVLTFFLLLDDLISSNTIEDRYQTISIDLHKTLINHRNIEDFSSQATALGQQFSQISSKSVDWKKYPFTTVRGNYDYEKCKIDTNKQNLNLVFSRFFKALNDAPFWVNRYIDKGMENFPRIIVAPTEIHTGRKFKEFTDEDFLNAHPNPLWKREPG